MWFKNSSKIFSSGEANITWNTLILSVKSSHDGAYMCQAELQGRNVTTAKSTPHLITVHGSQPTILLQQDPSHPAIYTGEQVKLTCSIQEKTSKWQYFWQKDSQQVNTDNNPIYTIQNATCSQQGNYTCQVRRGEMTYTKSTILTIREPPKLNLSIESQWHMFYQTEKVTLKCSVDEESNKWGYEWFKNGGLLKEDKDISFSGNTLSISSAKAGHSGQYTCRGKHLTRTSVTTRETEAVPLHIQDKKPKPTITKHEWFEFFYTEERVQLKCNMTGVGWEYKWYKDLNLWITNPELTIDAVYLNDAGDYHCKAQRGNFSVDSETLQVRVQKPPEPQIRSEWTEAFPGEKVSLECVIQGVPENWNYMWFKDSSKIFSSGDTNTTGNTLILSVKSSHYGAYMCQAELQGRNVTTAKSTPHLITVHGSQPTILLQQDPSHPAIYTGEQVKLTCSIQEKTSKWQYFWQKDSQQVNTDNNPIYTIQNATCSQQGNYTCQVRRGETTYTKSTILTIREPPKPNLSIESQWHMFYQTEKVTLKCSVDEESNKWGYEWFKNGGLVKRDENISFSGNTLSISSAKAGHSGQYTCRGKHLTRTSVTTRETGAVQLHIQDKKPKPTITKHEWFEFFYTEERVQLKCNMTGVGWEYKWYKDLNLWITNPELTINAVSLTDAGDYYCKALRGGFSVDSETLQVRVQKPPEPQIRSNWTEAFPGEKVSLKCVIQGVPENWNYMWFKNSSKIISSGETNITGNTLILSVKSSHYGAYMCQAELQGRNVMTTKSTPHLITVHGSQPTILLQQDPSHPAIYTGEQVKLTCSIQEKTSKWQYFWQKDSQQVNTDNNPLYSIQSATCSQQGNYTCQVRRGEMTYTKSTILTIREPPKLNLSIESQWHMFYQTEKVTLKCSVDEESNKWGYEWFKNGGLVKRDENISFSGNTLSISSAKVSHSGQYTCRGKHLTRTSVTTRETGAVPLHIQDKKPKPTITKHEWFEFFYTEERVQLKCNMTGVGWEYKWYKDLNFRITNPELTINAVSLTDAGDYYCKALRGGFSVDSETLQVRVQTRPPAFLIMETELSDIMTGDVTLRCNVSDGRQWNYTWFMNGQELNGSSDVLKVTGNEETIESEFKCKGINTERPLYSALSDGSIANNIIFKRKILLAISGSLVCCIVILIIGCIILKITRKPGVKETAPEDLLFSMTDSKNQTISPMKEYMDNRQTELEECQEKAELILDHASAVHEDGVIKDEDAPASVANGLTSFKDEDAPASVANGLTSFKGLCE